MSPGPIDELQDLADGLGRDDIVNRIRSVRERMSRSDTYVVVLGEFKQGKSSLINALVDAGPLCPVDDDTATAVVTIVSHAPRPEAATLAVGASEWSPTDLVTAGVAITAGDVEQVRIKLPSQVLEAGITIVDTPGVGGLDGGHTRASLAFLPYADAVLFVSDATAELSAAELGWFDASRQACPVTIPVLTKIDLAPSWRRIVELDTAHLARIGFAGSIVPTSATAYFAAIALDDGALAAESGVPLLRRTLIERIADPARIRATKAGTTDLRRLLRQLAGQVASERSLLDDDSESARLVGAAHERLAHLRGPAAKWQQRLTDQTGDISNRASFQFRGAMRALGQSIDGRVEALDSAADWETFSTDVQRELATAVSEVFAAVEQGFDALRRELYELIVSELPDRRLMESTTIHPDEVGDWLDAHATNEPGAGTRAMSAIRGAQSGLMMFGFLGQLLPAAAGALLLSSPLTLALGGAFAGKALLDVRKRSLSVRRTQLKQAARKLLDDAQFELGNRIAELSRNCSRAVRDEVAEALALAQRSATDALSAAQTSAQQSAAERSDRRASLQAIAADLRRLDAELLQAAAEEGR